MCLPIMAAKTCALVISKSSRKQSYDISFKNWNYLTYGRVLFLCLLKFAICFWQPLKNLKGYGLLYKFFKAWLPQILLDPFLNTLSNICTSTYKYLCVLEPRTLIHFTVNWQKMKRHDKFVKFQKKIQQCRP